MPGEVFLGGRRAMPSSVYLSLGAGSTRFAGDDHFTLIAGAGLRLLVTDWLAVHLDVRDHDVRHRPAGREQAHAEPPGQPRADRILLTMEHHMRSARILIPTLLLALLGGTATATGPAPRRRRTSRCPRATAARCA